MDKIIFFITFIGLFACLYILLKMLEDRVSEIEKAYARNKNEENLKKFVANKECEINTEKMLSEIKNHIRYLSHNSLSRPELIAKSQFEKGFRTALINITNYMELKEDVNRHIHNN